MFITAYNYTRSKRKLDFEQPIRPGEDLMTIKFEKIKPGMTLYDLRRTRFKFFGDLKKNWQHWRVKIIEVDAERRMVLASWNGNKEYWWSEKDITKLRAKLPKGDK